MEYQKNDSGLLADLKEGKKYACFIFEGANMAAVDSGIIFGIGSRESRWGLALTPKGPTGTGDSKPRNYTTKIRYGTMPPDGLGYGRGLMQIDFDAHPFAQKGEDWKDPKKNIMYGCKVLHDNLVQLKAKYNNLQLTEEQLVEGAIAGYNCGVGNVFRSIAAGDPIDYRTTKRNYSQDVLARAKWFTEVGGWNAV